MPRTSYPTMNSDRKAVGQRIKAARLKKRMTQAQLAIALNMRGPHIVSTYETGHTFPSLNVFAMLCEKLGISMDEMYHGKKVLQTRPGLDKI